MKQNLQNKILTIGLICVGLSACQTLPYQPYAREVKKKSQQGGVIALNLNHRSEDEQKAQTLMKNTCGQLDVQVLEEGEVVIGQETKSRSDSTYQQQTPGKQVGNLFGIPVTSGGRDASTQQESMTSTVAVKEWQIQYECTVPKVSETKINKKSQSNLQNNQSVKK